MTDDITTRLVALEEFQAKVLDAVPDIATLRDLIEQRAIEREILLYARGIDRVDADLIRGLFWPEALHVGGPVDGPFSAVADRFVDIRRSVAAAQHYLTNMLVDLDGPDRAKSEIYMLAYHQTAPGEEGNARSIGVERVVELGGDAGRSYDFFVGNRYLDDWEKRGDQWKVIRRRFVIDWHMTAPSSQVVKGGMLNAFAFAGTRDRDDELYRFLADR